MLSPVYCDCCKRPGSEVENIVVVDEAALCNDCVSYAARKMGLLPPRSAVLTPDAILITDRGTRTFTYTLELDGHCSQKYDLFVFQCLMDILRAEHWDVSIELARLTRTDGFDRERAAEGSTRYAVDLVIRPHEPIAEPALRVLLEERCAMLTRVNGWLLADKGTRDLLEPRLACLAAYVVSRVSEGRPH